MENKVYMWTNIKTQRCVEVMALEELIIYLSLNDYKTRPGNLVDAIPLIQALGGKGVVLSD